MGRREMSAGDVYRRLAELDALPLSEHPQQYIAYLLSEGSSPTGGETSRFSRIFGRTGVGGASLFVVNEHFPWGEDATRMIRRPTSWLLDALAPAVKTKKRAKKKTAPKKAAAKETPKNAWDRVLNSPLDDT